MERRVLWAFVVILLAVDILLLLQRRQTGARLQNFQRTAATALLKARYAAEEEALLIQVEAVPSGFPFLQAEHAAGDAVQLVLLASVDDCTNCIEDEVMKLNALPVGNGSRVTGIQGFFIDEDRRATANAFISHLSPAPTFPMSVRNVLPQVPAATTPLVLVIRSRDGKILDAHKPIPQDLTKRDAFYARWSAALGLT